MQPFSIVHDYDGTPQEFWELFFDDAYNRAFYDAVGIDFEVLREEEENGRLLRVVRYRLRGPVTGLMRPFLPDGLGYTEHAVFDAAASTLSHQIEPSALGSRTDIRGALTVKDAGAGRMRGTYAGSVSIRAPLLSGKLEVNTVANMVRSHEIAASVTRDWLARRASAQQASAQQAS